jgi:hypothetical protein
MTETEIRDIDIKTYYAIQKMLMREIYRSDNPGISFLETIVQFKPKTMSDTGWKSACINDAIDGYISNDNLIRRLQDKEAWTKEYQTMFAYSCGIDFAMRNGTWNEWYSSMARLVENKDIRMKDEKD